ncbi:MAG: hypothetical protein AAF699_22215 [Pseudomonadota bacterium]
MTRNLLLIVGFGLVLESQCVIAQSEPPRYCDAAKGVHCVLEETHKGAVDIWTYCGTPESPRKPIELNCSSPDPIITCKQNPEPTYWHCTCDTGEIVVTYPVKIDIGC